MLASNVTQAHAETASGQKERETIRNASAQSSCCFWQQQPNPLDWKGNSCDGETDVRSHKTKIEQHKKRRTQRKRIASSGLQLKETTRMESAGMYSHVTRERDKRDPVQKEGTQKNEMLLDPGK
jgi:hypothetical protein